MVPCDYVNMHIMGHLSIISEGGKAHIKYIMAIDVYPLHCILFHYF